MAKTAAAAQAAAAVMIRAMVKTIVFVVSLMLLTAAKELIGLSQHMAFAASRRLQQQLPHCPGRGLGKRKL
jgi:hypothetical protein